MKQFKTVTFIILVAVWLAVIFDWPWIWGILFSAWSIYIFMSGDATIVEPVYRKEHPGWFWFISITWILLSLSYFVPDAWWGQ